MGWSLLTLVLGFATCSFLRPAGCALGEVRARVHLRVLDARTGDPVPAADVFVGEAPSVADPRAQKEADTDPEPGESFFGRLARTRTDAAGMASLVGSTTLCTAFSGWEALTGSDHMHLEEWDGISVWIHAPGFEPRRLDHLSRPRSEVPGAGAYGGPLLEIDAGDVRLERAPP